MISFSHFNIKKYKLKYESECLKYWVREMLFLRVNIYHDDGCLKYWMLRKEKL